MPRLLIYPVLSAIGAVRPVARTAMCSIAFTAAFASFIGAQPARDLLGMVPQCQSTDKRAFDAFEKAYESAQSANQKSQTDVLNAIQANPASAMNRETIQLMSKWSEFTTTVGAPREIHSQADVFQPIQDWLNEERDRLETRKADCNLGSDPKSQACYNAAQKELDAVEQKGKDKIREKWPEYLSRVRTNIDWDSRPMPAGMSSQNLFIRQQLTVRDARAIEDAHIVFEELRTLCGDPRN